MRRLSFRVAPPQSEPSVMTRFGVWLAVSLVMTPFAAIGVFAVAAWLGLPAAVALVLGGVR